MKTSILLLAVTATLLLSACSSYQVTSSQGREMPCYSTWHEYPRNA